MKTIKIYTKNGDQGETCLVSGEKVKKSHIRLETYGTLDELNSHLGFAVSLLEKNAHKKQLKNSLADCLFKIQNDLFNLGSQLACADPELSKKLPGVTQEDISFMEKTIDELTEKLEPLKNFILPGGSELSASFHICRTVCRRAERICISLKNESDVAPLIIIYLNRLSDLLFVIARFCLKVEGIKEVEWKK